MTGTAVELAPYAGSEALERARAGHDTLAAGRHGQGADRDRLIARRVAIMELHLQGYTEREIAEVVGLGKSQAHREIVKGRQEWHERIIEAAETKAAEGLAVLVLARARLLRELLTPGIEIGDLVRLHAELIRNEESQRKLLGTDKPAKVEVSHPDADAQRQRAEELLGRADELAARRRVG